MRYLLTIDLGGTFTKLGLISKDADLMEKQDYKTPATYRQFLQMVESYYIQNKEHYMICGIAISSPGSVTETGEVLGYSSVPFIHEHNIREKLEDYFKLETSIENDANCVALGELWNGMAKGIDTFACIVCGTGIGGSIVINKKLHKGTHLHGGEFGYVIFARDNMEFNTWSEQGSSSALTRRLQHTAPYYENWTGPSVFEHFHEGHQEARESINIFFQTLAMGIFNIQYILDPERILIGGGITRQPNFMKELNVRLDELFREKPFAKVHPSVAVCHHLDKAQLFGAAYVWLERFGKDEADV
ncbi:ROK family protein [Halalkalibacter kiskunsagensis]|uniref:ROK family protein n=1 Tax=Halalkalibacter kiskunsagensis TaxID=1548599 RepID=A0ABV6K6V8_9BACI